MRLAPYQNKQLLVVLNVYIPHLDIRSGWVGEADIIELDGLWLLQQPHKLSYTLWFNLAFTLNQPIISFYLIVGGALQSSAQPHEKALQNASSTSKGHNPLWFLVATMGDANKV